MNCFKRYWELINLADSYVINIRYFLRVRGWGVDTESRVKNEQATNKLVLGLPWEHHARHFHACLEHTLRDLWFVTIPSPYDLSIMLRHPEYYVMVPENKQNVDLTLSLLTAIVLTFVKSTDYNQLAHL